MENSISISANIPATPEVVWRVLTSPEHLAQIFKGQQCGCEWTVGAKVRFLENRGGKEKVVEKGEVIRVSANKLLEYSSFPTQMGLEDTPENYIVVCYELLDNYDGSTHLAITQKGYKYVEGGMDRYISAQKNWKKHLPKLIEATSTIKIDAEA